MTFAVRHRSRDTDVLTEMLSAYSPPLTITLPATGTMLDLGGNIGLLALWALERCPGCRVISYEPDPTNQPLLARTTHAAGSATAGTRVRCRE
jgi:tRNA1(Val) A37 N6-methylase TrmN6